MDNYNKAEYQLIGLLSFFESENDENINWINYFALS